MHHGEYTGLDVVISGVKSRPELNGAEALAVSWDLKSGRYAVLLLGSRERLALKAQNLSPVTPSSQRTAASAGLTLVGSIDGTSQWRFDDDDGSGDTALLGIRGASEGLGGFALRQIAAGERLLIEAPLLAWSPRRSNPHHGTSTSPRVGDGDGEDPYSLGEAVAELSVGARRAFWALEHHPREQQGDAPKQLQQRSGQQQHAGQQSHLSGMWQRHAIPLFDDAGTSAAFRLSSRLNHSCLPNAHAAWNPSQQRLTVHAIAPIGGGAEVTIHYGGGSCDGARRQQRQAALQRTFGFTCVCSLCSLPADRSAQSDARQAEVAELGWRIQSASSQPAECVPLVTRRLELMAREGMRTVWETYGAAMHSLGRSRDFRGAAQWAARAATCAQLSLGRDSTIASSFARPLVALEGEWVSAGRRLQADGYVILDGFTGAHSASALASQLTRLYQDAGGTAEFCQGDVGGGPEGVGDDIRNNDAIRGDKRALVDVTDTRCPTLHSAFFLVDQMLAAMANGGGVAELSEVTHRSRPMLSCYDGGARYVRHVDNADDNGRLLTCILYLNQGRKADDGGELVLYPTAAGGGKSTRAEDAEDGQRRPRVVVEPLLDRLVCFWSDERTPHEVLPAKSERLAVSAWYHNRLPSQVRGEVSKLVEETRRERHGRRGSEV